MQGGGMQGGGVQMGRASGASDSGLGSRVSGAGFGSEPTAPHGSSIQATGTSPSQGNGSWGSWSAFGADASGVSQDQSAVSKNGAGSGGQSYGSFNGGSTPSPDASASFGFNTFASASPHSSGTSEGSGEGGSVHFATSFGSPPSGGGQSGAGAESDILSSFDKFAASAASQGGQRKRSTSGLANGADSAQLLVQTPEREEVMRLQDLMRSLCDADRFEEALACQAHKTVRAACAFMCSLLTAL